MHFKADFHLMGRMLMRWCNDCKICGQKFSAILASCGLPLCRDRTFVDAIVTRYVSQDGVTLIGSKWQRHSYWKRDLIAEILTHVVSIEKSLDATIAVVTNFSFQMQGSLAWPDSFHVKTVLLFINLWNPCITSNSYYHMETRLRIMFCKSLCSFWPNKE